MVVDSKDIVANPTSDEAIVRNLKNAERLIDGELRCNADRLSDGKEVMICCVMPYARYESLLKEYESKGWMVRHEPNHAYGRLYFKK